MHEWQVSSEFETSEMIERAALGVSLARVLLVSELACTGKIFIPAKKVPPEQKAVPVENGIHVFQTIFTLVAGFLLASRDKKLHSEPRGFFWR
jgi:hypothetical protein